MSSVEVEFRDMVLGLYEALWLRFLLLCENKVACDNARNLVQHNYTKHVVVVIFFINEKLDNMIVELPRLK